jgi:hypothetical protein
MKKSVIAGAAAVLVAAVVLGGYVGWKNIRANRVASETSVVTEGEIVPVIEQPVGKKEAGTVAAQAARPSDAELSATIQAQARILGQAVMVNDAAAVVRMTYPKLVEMMGGKEGMESELRKIYDQGFAVEKVTIGNVSEILTVGTEVQATVEEEIRIAAPGQGVFLAHGTLIGISEDGGKTWRFIDASQTTDVSAYRKLFPNLSPKLSIPEPRIEQLSSSE